MIGRILNLVTLAGFAMQGLAGESSVTFTPVDGMTIGPDYVVFEAEATNSPLGYWQVIRPGDYRYQDKDPVGPIGQTHLEFTGNDPNLGPPASPLEYTFRCPRTGTYRLGARLFQRLEGLPDDKCNDVYIRMSGNFTSGNHVSTDELKQDQKFYGRGVNEWGALYNLEAHEAGHAPAIYSLIEGEIYTLTVSGRAQRTNIDYWLLYETSLPIVLQGHKDLAAENDPIYRPQPESSDSLAHPVIFVRPEERYRLLQMVEDYDWAQNLVDDLRGRVDVEVALHRTDPGAILRTIPEIADNDGYSESQASASSRGHFDVLSRASYAGMLYFLKGDESYAQFAADILNFYIEELADRTPQTTSICGNYFYDPRTTYPHFALAYDFIHNFLKRPGTMVYNLAGDSLAAFDNNKAQKAVINIAGNALGEYLGADTHGRTISNHPVLTAPGVLFPILCIEDTSERERLFEVFWNTGTKRQNSFTHTILPMFGEQGIWPESTSYSFMPNISLILNVVDRIKPELNAAARYQGIFNGAFLFENLRNPDRSFVRYGDSKRKTDATDLKYRYVLDIAKRKGYTDLQGKAEAALELMYAANGGRDDGIASGNFDNYSPLALFWGEPLPGSSVPMFDYKPTVIIKHAGVALQRNYAEQDNYTYGLCGIIGGAHYVHSHCTGIAMEIYGQGYVMGPNGGLPPTVAERQLPVHSDYFRLYAGNNTVIVNGTSHGIQPGSWKNDAYLWQNTTVNVAAEPLHLQDPICRDFSFATQFLKDEVNDCDQQRTLSTIRTSPTTGYYFDLFRSRSLVENNFHDYIYHNIGDATHLMNEEGEPLELTSTDRYDNDIGDPVHSPGWRYFENEQVTDPVTDAVNVRFDILANKRYMHMKIPGGTGREYTRALAPPTREAKNGYVDKKTQLLAIRQQGEAWQKPFIAVFEPSASITPSVSSVKPLETGGAVVGAMVRSTIGRKVITDYIISTDAEDGTVELPVEDIRFAGRFEIVRKEEQEDSSRITLYIGQGSRLSMGENTLVADPDKRGYMIISEVDSSFAENHMVIEAEDFDEGGEGVGYHDWDSANYGDEKAYREAEGVDLSTSLFAGNGIVVSRVRPGEWLDYTFDVQEKNAWFLGIQASNPRFDFASLDAFLDDSLVLEGFRITKTESWDDYQVFESPGSFLMDSGEHKLRIFIMQEDFNFDRIIWRKDRQYVSNLAPPVMEVKLFPNPCRDRLTIQLEKNRTAVFFIYSCSGVKVMSGQFNAHTSLDLTDQVQGVYLLELVSGNRRAMHRILKM